MKAYSILVTGGNGQLGRALQEASVYNPHFTFHFYSREALDITQEEDIEKVIAQTQVDLVINTAAYTAVDKAEEEYDKAYLINEKAVGYIAKRCKVKGIPLLHLSTDYVYHNDLTRPLIETDPVHPHGIYAKSKLAGEILAQSILEKTLIIRTSWVFGVYGHNFVKTMLRLGSSGRSLKVVNDQFGSPTCAHDLSLAIMQLLPGFIEGRVPPGVYNFCNSGKTSWYGFAKKIFEESGIHAKIQGIPTNAYPTPAERPSYSVMNTSKIRKYLNSDIPSWETSLAKYLHRIQQQLIIDQNPDS